MHAFNHTSPASRLFNAMLSNQALAHGEPSLSVDVLENDHGYTLRANVPGAAKDDLTVSIDDKTVKIEVNFKDDAETGAVWRERHAGKVSRTLKFAVALDADAANAKQENGVLTLNLPKKSDAQVKRITIQ